MLNANEALVMSNSSISLSSYGVTEFSRIESLITTEAKSGGKSVTITLAIYDGEGDYKELIMDHLEELGYTVTEQDDNYIISWESTE